MQEVQNQEEIIIKEPKKRKHLGRKIALVVVLLVVVVLAVQVAVADKYKATVLPIAGEKKVGVNPTTALLDFGDLSHDTSATRTVSLASASGRDTYVYILKFGAISDLMQIDQSSFVLKGGEEKKIGFNVYMPNSAPVGKRMDGNVWIFKVPKIW